MCVELASYAICYIAILVFCQGPMVVSGLRRVALAISDGNCLTLPCQKVRIMCMLRWSSPPRCRE